MLGLAGVLAAAMLPVVAHAHEPGMTPGSTEASWVAAAQELGQVQDVTVTQADGFATVAWSPVDGATAYELARTPLDADGVPIGDELIVGLWRPNRQINADQPTFADAGFLYGERYQWRVRALIDGEPQPYSDPVSGTTNDYLGPEEFLTEFELVDGARYTSYENEIDWTYRLAAASDRVRVVTLGHTIQGREINAFIIGYPVAPATAEEVSASPSAGSTCNVHGNEPTGREACFTMIRHMAFSDDPWVIDTLSNATALFVPSLNGDGRAANTRGNATGQDLNRDYGVLSQPETFAQAAFWRDYTPEVLNDGHHYGNTNTCDLPVMITPHLNNSEATYNEGRLGMIEGWMYGTGAAEGWWPCPYPVAFSPGGQSFGSTTGLKHIIGMLTEARSQAGPTRPNAAGAANTRRQHASHLWTIRQVFDYHRENLPRIQRAIADSIAFQRSNTGPVVFGGAYDWDPLPAPHPGENPPPHRRPGPADMIGTPPCGYLLTAEEYLTPLADSANLPVHLRTSPAERLAAHGVEVHARADDYLVRMEQPLRGLIPLILDAQTLAVGAPIIIAAERVFAEAVCSSTFGLVGDRLDELVAADGIREIRARQARLALDAAAPRIADPLRQRGVILQLEQLIATLEREAAQIEAGAPYLGDPDGLRALAAAIAALIDTYRAV